MVNCWMLAIIGFNFCQVTVLLKECRDIQLRCGSANNDLDGAAMIISANDITAESDAQRVISERLVCSINYGTQVLSIGGK